MSVANSFVFFDLETTDICNDPKITELSLISVTRTQILNSNLSKDFNPPRALNKISLCIYPGKLIHPRVTEITGLSNELLQEFAVFNVNTVNLIHAFFNLLPKPICLLAHNGFKFDYPILKAALKRLDQCLPESVRCADTLPAFKHVFKEWNSNILTENLNANSTAVSNSQGWLDDGNDDMFLDIDCEEIHLDELENEEPKIGDVSFNSTNKLKESWSQVSWDTTQGTPKKSRQAEVSSDMLNITINGLERLETTPMGSKDCVSNVTPQEKGKNFVKARKDLFPPFPNSYKLIDIYDRLRNSRPENHRAEADSLMLLECVLVMGPDILKYFDDNFKLFEDM